MARYRFLLFFFIVVIFQIRAQSDIPKKVLFVGNSYTYFWNLPQNVALLAESQNIDLKTAQSTIGGSNLGQHWRSDRELKSVELIKTGEYDAIVLQDFSMQAIQHPDSLIYYGELLGKLIKSNNAKPYLYMTWARQWDPLMQQPIVEKYTELGKKIGAVVVPVGLAWQTARSLRSDLKIFDEDGSHPSALGTYLSACVFYGVLTGKSPIGLPNRLTTTDKNGEKLYINIQSAENALFCQKVAAQTIEEFRR